MLLKCYNLYFFQFFLHQPINNYPKGTFMGLQKKTLMSYTAILKMQAPGAPPWGSWKFLIHMAIRVKKMIFYEAS